MNGAGFLRNASKKKSESRKGYEGEKRIRFCDFFHKASPSVRDRGEGSMYLISWCWAGLLWTLL